MQWLWRVIWKHKLTIYIPQDPAMPLPGILIRDILFLYTKRYSQGCSLHKKYALLYVCTTVCLLVEEIHYGVFIQRVTLPQVKWTDPGYMYQHEQISEHNVEWKQVENASIYVNMYIVVCDNLFFFFPNCHKTKYWGIRFCRVVLSLRGSQAVVIYDFFASPRINFYPFGGCINSCEIL